MAERSYILVRWLHQKIEEPILLYSALDEERNELRKVELFSDGRAGFAGPSLEYGGTRLGVVPLPTFDEINADPQFEMSIIPADDFDVVWHKVLAESEHGRT